MSSNNTPESIVVATTGPYAGSSFVGGPGAAVINQFNTSTGAPIQSYGVKGGNGTGGTDWTELQSATSHNILYDGEGTQILSYNLATKTQNADFTSAATEAALDHIFAFRVIPSGTFGGDVLVANSVDAVLLGSSGNIIKTYTLPGNGGTDFSLNLKTSTNPGWVSKCAGESRNGPAECSMEDTLVLENTGESVAFIVVRTQSDTREPVMTIRVPVGLYLPAGLNIQIDDTKPQPVPLQTCNLQSCFAEMQISSTLLAALKGGKRLSIICQSLAKNKIMLPLALDNFADAFQKIQ
jgi:invasion protein IalB